jgi:hypothetical protein
MNTAISALSGQYLDTRSFRYARNQRDAGIEHLQWEDRIKPLRPLSYDIALALGAVCAGITALFMI